MPNEADRCKGTVFENIELMLDTQQKLKKVMLRKGLTRARCKCTMPGCDGTIHGQMRGRKNHLHMACDKCSFRIME